MPDKQTKRGLGRNFGSLLPNDFDESLLIDKQDRVQKLFISSIQPDPDQPRKHFDENALDELSISIKRHGVLQPLVVNPKGDKFIIIAGERRYRAAKKAGLTQLPAIVRTSEELERTEIGLVENVQRVDLSPIEQAVSIMKLHEQFNVSYSDIAKRLGKAETTIVNTARLLQLPKESLTALEKAQITEGHARAILALRAHPQKQKKLLETILRDKISVRQAEQFVASNKTGKQRPKPSSAKALQHEQLTDKLGSKVTIVKTAKGGKIQIVFSSEKQMNDIIDSLL